MCDSQIQISDFPYIKIGNIVIGHIDQIDCFKKLHYFEAKYEIKTNEVALRNCSQSNLIPLYQQKRMIYAQLIDYMRAQNHFYFFHSISAEIKTEYYIVKGMSNGFFIPF